MYIRGFVFEGESMAELYQIDPFDALYWDPIMSEFWHFDKHFSIVDVQRRATEIKDIDSGI